RHTRSDRDWSSDVCSSDLIESTGRLSAVASRGALEFLRKAEYAYDYGMPQWMARIDHLLLPLRLERLFLGRHKFSHFRVWYRDRSEERRVGKECGSWWER